MKQGMKIPCFFCGKYRFMYVLSDILYGFFLWFYIKSLMKRANEKSKKDLRKIKEMMI